MKRTHSGSGGVDLEEPYALCATDRPSDKQSIVSFGGSEVAVISGGSVAG